MLQYGIPEYRLPKDVLRAEIAHIMKLGVSIKTGVKIGTDLSLGALKEDYQAVFRFRRPRRDGPRRERGGRPRGHGGHRLLARCQRQ